MKFYTRPSLGLMVESTLRPAEQGEVQPRPHSHRYSDTLTVGVAGPSPSKGTKATRKPTVSCFLVGKFA